MKFLKFGFIFAYFAVFVACAQNQTTVINGGNTATVVNSNTVLPTNATTASTPDEIASAKQIYVEKCAKCHKENGEGGVTDIEGTKIKAPNFTSERKKNDKDEEWIEIIENGAKEDGMPAYKGKISDAEIKNLVSYIRREFQGK